LPSYILVMRQFYRVATVENIKIRLLF